MSYFIFIFEDCDCCIRIPSFPGEAESMSPAWVRQVEKAMGPVHILLGPSSWMVDVASVPDQMVTLSLHRTLINCIRFYAQTSWTASTKVN